MSYPVEYIQLNFDIYNTDISNSKYVKVICTSQTLIF